MRIGVMSGFGPGATPEYVAQTAVTAEEHGIHSIWVPEHVLFFREYASQYPYSADGKLPGNPEGVLEPFTALTYMAAHTKRIRLGTGICLIPQRSPIYTAKQVADLDYLSGGRVDLGVGIGWLREEFDALGIPWERRAARTRECIGVMQTLWCDEVSHYEGEFFSFPNCLQNPKPVQQPHPPIHFGGESDAALRRVARLGQGWYGFNLTPEALSERLERLDALLSEAGRSRDDVTISVAPYGQRADPEQAKPYRDLGVDQLIVGFFARSVEGLPAAAERIAALIEG